MMNVRRSLMTGAAFVALTITALSPRPAEAQLATVCTNCSTLWTQLVQYSAQAKQLETELEGQVTRLNMYANMVTNTLALPGQIWSTVQGDIMRVQALANAGSLLSGNAGSIVTRLQNASAYANQAASLGNIAGQFSQWQTTIGNSLNTMGQQLGVQQGQQASTTALLSSLQSHSQSAVGQLQAIQAANELAHANATQLAQIQATLSTTAQMQGTWMAVQADRQAAGDAAMAHFNSAPVVPLSGYREW